MKHGVKHKHKRLAGTKVLGSVRECVVAVQWSEWTPEIRKRIDGTGDQFVV
jgi:hypothetical protein